MAWEERMHTIDRNGESKFKQKLPTHIKTDVAVVAYQNSYITVLLRSNIGKPIFISIWVFLISLANTIFVKKTVGWLFGSDTKKILLLSAVKSLIFLCFLTFSIVFQKTALFTNLKKPFPKLFTVFFLNFVLISIYGFSQAFWLYLITLWTSFKNNPWFNACFKFLMQITSKFVM